jgi:hypothetical protein
MKVAFPLILLLWIASPGHGVEVKVTNAAEFRDAVSAAKPGTRIILAGGDYGSGFRFANLRGEKGNPIVIKGADAKIPPVFHDGSVGIHLSNPAYVELDGLVFSKLSGNGLNIDDGANTKSPETALGIVLRNLQVRDIGADGNNDGIKLSGLWDFRVVGCSVERWGTKGGSAIDMVGCHRGLIESNLFRHITPAPGNCTGVQCKGGTSEMVIRKNRFENAGGRAVNIGGSTGQSFFRPALDEGKDHFEAKDLIVEGNVFVGGVAPVGFVGVDGAKVRFNTIENPGRWALRILQENKTPGFVPSRNGEFTDNIVVFDSAHWSEGGVNIGPGVAPETFKFARNWWYCSDQPERSQPKLPTPEVGGSYGKSVAEARGKAGAEALPK